MNVPGLPQWGLGGGGCSLSGLGFALFFPYVVTQVVHTDFVYIYIYIFIYNIYCLYIYYIYINPYLTPPISGKLPKMPCFQISRSQIASHKTRPTSICLHSLLSLLATNRRCRSGNNHAAKAGISTSCESLKGQLVFGWSHLAKTFTPVLMIYEGSKNSQ